MLFVYINRLYVVIKMKLNTFSRSVFDIVCQLNKPEYHYFSILRVHLYKQICAMQSKCY